MGDQSLRVTSPDTVVSLPLRAYEDLDKDYQAMQYLPFSSADLYNRKAQPLPLSDNLKELINLFETVSFTHQPTWDDIQQLMRMLFTTKE